MKTKMWVGTIIVIGCVGLTGCYNMNNGCCNSCYSTVTTCTTCVQQSCCSSYNSCGW
ncbi:MAG TPA: hypothetical protein VLI69_02180 [Gammaproteobacteria bacterium]|nr:hypothetical protein [Gammaproteobacteria bacterium]